MKILTKIVIGVIITLIVFAFIYALFFGKAGAPTIDHSVTQNATANWKIYTTKLSGLSLQVPADFKLTVSLVSSESVITPELLFEIPKQAPYFNTHLINEANVVVNQPVSTCNLSGDEVIDRKEINISGTTFTRTHWDGIGAGNIYEGIDYTTIKGGKCYQITLFTHSANGEGLYTDNAAQIAKVDAQHKQDMTALFKLFDQIAGTIKFSK